MKRQTQRLALIAAMFLGAWLTTAQSSSMGKPTAQSRFIAPHSIPVQELVGNPPADGSAEQKAESEAVLALQAKRTPAEVARCQTEVNSTPFTFAEAIGPWFTPQNLPITVGLFGEVTSETKAEVSSAKKLFNRPRPSVTDPRIHPCVELETSPTYPSGHGTRGIVWGTILAELFPDKKEQIMAIGKRIGDDRVIAGMHYPSDVIAGQKLGAEIAKQMLASPQMTDSLAKAKGECEKVAQANAGK